MGKPLSFQLRVIVGILLIVAGLMVNRHAFNTWGADFAQGYMSGWMLREGKNVYNFDVQHDGYMRHIGEVTTWGHFYPPSTAVVALPTTILPYPVAREMWFVVVTIAMLVGLWFFMAVYIKAWDSSYRVLILGIVMCAAATRWSFKVAQPGPLVIGGLAFFVIALKYRKSLPAGLIGVVIAATKVTFGLPFFLIAFAARRFKLTAVMVGLVGILNVIGLYGMGGPAIISDYKANMAQFERPDQLNYPDPRGSNSLARTDWAYILNAIDPNFKRNNILSSALSILAVAWLGLVIIRLWKANVRADADTIVLALMGPVTALSMLVVYHHHYDMEILALPLIAYVGRKEIRELPAAWFYIVPVALYIGLYPYEKAAQGLDFLMGPNGVLIAKPLACAVCIMAFVSSMMVLQSAVRLQASNLVRSE